MTDSLNSYEFTWEARGKGSSSFSRRLIHPSPVFFEGRIIHIPTGVTVTAVVLSGMYSHSRFRQLKTQLWSLVTPLIAHAAARASRKPGLSSKQKIVVPSNFRIEFGNYPKEALRRLQAEREKNKHYQWPPLPPW